MSPRIKRSIAATAVVATVAGPALVVTAPAYAHDGGRGGWSGGWSAGPGARSQDFGSRSFGDPSHVKSFGSDKGAFQNANAFDPGKGTDKSRAQAPAPLPRPDISVRAPEVASPGSAADITATFTLDGDPIAGETVTLYQRATAPSSVGKFHKGISVKRYVPVTTATTGADGTASFSVTVDGTTSYKVGIARTDDHKSASKRFSIGVQTQPVLTLGGWATPSSYLLFARLADADAADATGYNGKWLTLNQSTDGGATWTKVADRFTWVNGYAYFAVPPASGTSYQVTFAGSKYLLPASSPVVTQP